MTIPAVGAVSPIGSPMVVGPMTPTASTGTDFAARIGAGLEQLQGLHSTTDNLAVQAATGSLTDVHNYMIASTQASVATELTVAVRNKAIEAFQEIMRMQA